MGTPVSTPVLNSSEAVSTETYEDFVSWYEWNPQWRRKAFEKIWNLKDVLKGEDPISYIHWLYFEERKSLREILATPIISWIDFVSTATLQRLLFEHFNWTPRQKTERTPVHEQKLHDDIQTGCSVFKSGVQQMLAWQKINRVFKMKELEQKEHRVQKALYILSALWDIDRTMLLRLSQEQRVSNATIAHAVNQELEKILKIFPEKQIDFDEVKVYPQSIARLLACQNNKLGRQK